MNLHAYKYIFHKTSVNVRDDNHLVAGHFNENGHSLKNMKVIGIPM